MEEHRRGVDELANHMLHAAHIILSQLLPVCSTTSVSSTMRWSLRWGTTGATWAGSVRPAGIVGWTQCIHNHLASE